MRPNQVDWQTLQRIDNAAVIDFLTTTAAVLCENEQLGERHADQLRLLLSGIQAREDRNTPTMLAIWEQDPTFLQICLARWGAPALITNICRHTLRPQLKQITQAIGHIGNDLVERAALYFNRPFTIYQGTAESERVLFATVLLDFSEQLAITTKELDTLLESWADFEGHHLPSECDTQIKIDEEMAAALGFKQTTRIVRPDRTTQAGWTKLSNLISHLAADTLDFCEQLTRNGMRDESHRLLLSCRRLQSEALELANHAQPIMGDFAAAEHWRLHLVGSIGAIETSLQQLADGLTATIATARSAPVKSSVPDAAKRYLTYQMIVEGTPAAEAEAATSSLFHYLQAKGIGPEELIPAELTKIHPALKPDMLVALKSLATDHKFMTQAEQSKAVNLRRKSELANKFQRFVATSASTAVLIACIVGLGLAGCGLKTNAKSDRLEVRPDLPFPVQIIPPKPSAKPNSSDRP